MNFRVDRTQTKRYTSSIIDELTVNRITFLGGGSMTGPSGGGSGATTPQIISLVNAVTNTSSYTPMASWIFRGSDSVGTPTGINVVAYVSTDTYSIQIQDITNATIIATTSILSNTNSEIISMGTLSNIPTTPAQFEISARRESGSTSTIIQLSSVEIVYN